jgi:hypothetical protein
MQNGRGWGQDATLSPGWAHLRDAAVRAVKAPEVWAPAITAGLLQIGGADEEISEWAVDETPIFGSNSDAKDASDVLVDVGSGLFIVSALAAPSGDDTKQWFWSKTKGLAVGFGSLFITSNIPSPIKDGTKRERPNEKDDESFPSGHAASAAVRYTLAYRNFSTHDMPDSARTALRLSAVSLSLSTGWARVEAAEHYPADILFGMALGHFIGSFMTDAFLGLEAGSDVSVAAVPEDGGMRLSLAARF